MELTWLVPVAGATAALYALWLARDVLSRDTGTVAMQEIGGMIFEGAMARSMMPMVLRHLLQPDPRTLISISMSSSRFH